jgi:hypothetical protein
MKPQVNLATFSNDLLVGVSQIIENSRKKVSVFLNTEATMMYWSIGIYVNRNLKENNRTEYGSKIKVVQYLTELPDKQRFTDKLHKALDLVKKH